MESDPVLRKLVEMVETGEIPRGPAISLTIGGSTIMGRLIPQKIYFDLWAQASLGAQGNKEDILSAVDYMRVLRKEGQQGEAHLHLRDARVDIPEGLEVEVVAMLWRGKIAAVDGFWFPIQDRTSA